MAGIGLAGDDGAPGRGRSGLCLEGVETGLAVDSRGNLYVSDPANLRVLEYDAPFETDTAADRVLGQASFTATDHRVLRFDRPSPAGDRLPDGVLGQVDFLHATVNRVDARGLFAPTAVALDASVHPPRLYVADGGNSRVLAWRDATAFRNGEPADLVIG